MLAPLVTFTESIIYNNSFADNVDNVCPQESISHHQIPLYSENSIMSYPAWNHDLFDISTVLGAPKIYLENFKSSQLHDHSISHQEQEVSIPPSVDNNSFEDPPNTHVTLNSSITSDTEIISESSLLYPDQHDDPSTRINSSYRENFIPKHAYIFNPDIHSDIPLSIPKIIFQTANDNKNTHNISSSKEVINISHMDNLLCINEKFLSPNDVSTPQNELAEKNSITYHMPQWKYYNFDIKEQENFIMKYFPDRSILYNYYKHKEQRENMFVYLWIYMHGGIYISSDYEITRSLEPILNLMDHMDLYFIKDEDRYISVKFVISKPFCHFWIEVLDEMEKRKNNNYFRSKDEIDKNTGRSLLTDMVDMTGSRYGIIPRHFLNPYDSCDTEYNKDSFLRPVTTSQNIMTYMKCKTGSSEEVIYVVGTMFFLLLLIFLIATTLL